MSLYERPIHNNLQGNTTTVFGINSFCFLPFSVVMFCYNTEKRNPCPCYPGYYNHKPQKYVLQIPNIDIYTGKFRCKREVYLLLYRKHHIIFIYINIGIYIYIYINIHINILINIDIKNFGI